MEICPVESLRAWHGSSGPSPEMTASWFIREPGITALSLQYFAKAGKREVPQPLLGGALLRTGDRLEFLLPTLRVSLVPTLDTGR
jgi:hypothetical protein